MAVPAFGLAIRPIGPLWSHLRISQESVALLGFLGFLALPVGTFASRASTPLDVFLMRIGLESERASEEVERKRRSDRTFIALHDVWKRFGSSSAPMKRRPAERAPMPLEQPSPMQKSSTTPVPLNSYVRTISAMSAAGFILTRLLFITGSFL